MANTKAIAILVVLSVIFASLGALGGQHQSLPGDVVPVATIFDTPAVCIELEGTQVLHAGPQQSKVVATKVAKKDVPVAAQPSRSTSQSVSKGYIPFRHGHNVRSVRTRMLDNGAYKFKHTAGSNVNYDVNVGSYPH